MTYLKMLVFKNKYLTNYIKKTRKLYILEHYLNDVNLQHYLK